MNLVQVEVDNFLSHAHEVVPIPQPGITLLWGRSGAGKSSLVVDAVGYALFGVDATRAKRTSELRNLRAPGEAMRVMVVLRTDEGKSIEVERGLDAKDHSWARLTTSDGIEVTGPSAVGQQLHALLGGIDWRTFYLSFVARQEEISELTKITGAERREYVHQLLGLKNLDTATTITRRRAREQGTHIRLLEQQLGTVTREQLLADVETCAATTTATAEVHGAALVALEDAQTRADTAQAEQRRLDEVRQVGAQATSRVTRLRAERGVHAQALADARTRLAADEARLMTLPRPDDLDGRERLLRGEAAQYDGIRRRADADARVGVEIERAVAALAATDAALAALGPASRAAGVDGSLDDEIERVRERQSELRARWKALNERLREAHPSPELHETTCPTCLRAIDEGSRERVVEHLARLRAQLEEEQASVAADGQTARTRLTDLETLARALAEHTTATERLAAERQRLVGEVERLRAERDRVRADGAWEYDEAAHRALLAEIDQITQASRASTEAKLLAERIEQTRAGVTRDEEALAGLDAGIAEAAAALAASGYDEADDERARGATAETMRRLADARLAAQAATHARDEAARAHTRAHARLTDLEGQLAQLATHREEFARLTDLEGMFASFKRHLAAQIRPELTAICSEMLMQLSGGKFSAIEITEDYDILAQGDTGEWMPIRLISGGENARANLCLRLALTRLVSQRTGVPLRWLVFDEPLESQDGEQRDNIMKLLTSLQAFYPQVLLIAHDADLLDAEQVGYVMQFGAPTMPGQPAEGDRVAVYAT